METRPGSRAPPALPSYQPGPFRRPRSDAAESPTGVADQPAGADQAPGPPWSCSPISTPPAGPLSEIRQGPKRQVGSGHPGVGSPRVGRPEGYQTGSGTARPSRFAVGYAEPGRPRAGPVDRRSADTRRSHPTPGTARGQARKPRPQAPTPTPALRRATPLPPLRRSRRHCRRSVGWADGRR